MADDKAAEVASEVPAVTETAEEVKTPTESKEDKTPETPVTEPITNGSSTPESPKVETPVVDEEPVVTSPESVKVEPKETEPEQLPLNGLSLEEPGKEIPENGKNEDSKEEPSAETTEIVPEISVKKEVCVEQMSLIDSTPPPLPANPPPSSVASFAATTMAPELTDASLANTADNANPSLLPSDPITKDKLDVDPPESDKDSTVIKTINNEPSPVKVVTEVTSIPISEIEIPNQNDKIVDSTISVENKVDHEIVEKLIDEVHTLKESEPNVLACGDIEKAEIENKMPLLQNEETIMPLPPSENIEISGIEEDKVSSNIAEPEMPSPPSEIIETSALEDGKVLTDTAEQEMPSPPSELVEELDNEKNVLENIEPTMPSPPPESTEKHVQESLQVDDAAITNLPSVDPIIEEVAVSVMPDSLKIENKIESEELSVIAEPELPVPPAEVSIITEGMVSLNNVEDMPSPPPPICEDAITEENNLHDMNEIINGSNHINDAGDTINVNTDLKNDNEDLEQNLKNITKDSLGNLIKPIECNGNTEQEKESPDVIIHDAKESAKIISQDINLDSARPATLEDSSKAGDRLSESCPPPLSELTHHESDSTTPQEPLSVGGKLADLISEVPEVPECITETLQETTNDVAVAN